MVSGDAIEWSRYPPKVLVGIGLVTFTLFVGSFLVDVRIILVRPNYGDITGTLQWLFRAAVGIATLSSFFIAVHNLRTGGNDSESPATGFEIRGRHHDIDVHLHFRDSTRSNETAENETSDRDEESNPTDSTEDGP